MNDKTKDYLRGLAQRRPDLVSARKAEQFIKGLPSDSEFCEMRPAHEGCCVFLPVSCAQWGKQKLQITVTGDGSITPLARKQIRRIRDGWAVIWAAAFHEWRKEYPDWNCPEGVAVEWVLEGTIPATGFFGKLLGNDRWELGISGNAAVTVLSLQMKGTDITAAELI